MKASTQTAQEWNEEGEEKFVRKDFSRACICFSEAIKLDSTNYMSFWNRSKCLYWMKKYSDALEDVNECIRLKINFTGAYATKRNILLQIQDFVGAFCAVYDGMRSVDLEGSKKLYMLKDEIVKTLTVNGELHHLKVFGFVDFLRQSDYQVILRNLHPKKSEELLKDEDFLDKVERVKKSTSESMFLYNDEKMALIVQTMNDEARLVNYGDFNSNFIEGSMLLDRMQFQEAIPKFDQSIKGCPDLAVFLNAKGDIFFKRGSCHFRLAQTASDLDSQTLHLKKAKEDIEKARFYNPINPNYILLLAEYYDFQEDYWLAKKFSDETIEGMKTLASPTDSRLSPVYHFRGKVFEKLEKLDNSLSNEAEKDFNQAIALNPKNFFAYLLKGKYFNKKGRHSEAIEAIEISIRIHPEILQNVREDPPILALLGELYGKIGEYEKMDKYFKEAIDLFPTNPEVYEGYVYAMYLSKSSRYDERIVEYIERCEKLYHERNTSLSIEWETLKKVVKKSLVTKYKEITDDTSMKYELKLFAKDSMSTNDREMEEVKALKKTIQTHGFDEKTFPHLRLFRKLGTGAFAITYRCDFKKNDNEQGISGDFVIKVIKDPFADEEKTERMIKRDCTEIPYHRNIVMTYFHPNFKSSSFDVKKFPDYEEYWEVMFPDMERLITPVIIMKYHRKNLNQYMKERRKLKKPLSDLETCYILCGLLKGVRHLHSNMIVHRDLHEENVFVDEEYGRVFIGDFGCCVDLRAQDDFKVKDGDSFITTYNSGTRETNKGGCDIYLAPEIVDHKTEEKICGMIDYFRNDLFSVGMLGYYIVLFPIISGVIAPFGVLEDSLSPVVKDRKQENYKEIPEGLVDPRVSGLIKRLLMVDPRLRFSQEEAVTEIEIIIHLLEQRKANGDISGLKNVVVEEKKVGLFQNIQKKFFEFKEQVEKNLEGMVEMMMKAGEINTDLNIENGRLRKEIERIQRKKGEEEETEKDKIDLS